MSVCDLLVLQMSKKSFHIGQLQDGLRASYQTSQHQEQLVVPIIYDTQLLLSQAVATLLGASGANLESNCNPSQGSVNCSHPLAMYFH